MRKKNYRSEALGAVHEAMADLHEAGLLDTVTMREFDASCLTPEYLNAAMKHAQFERMEDGKYFASIPGLDGLWAAGASPKEAHRELEEVLPGWLYVHTTKGGNPPPEIKDK